MSWSDDLQTASFRNVKFDVMKITDSGAHAIAQHEYPYLDGADIEDMGLKPHSTKMTLVFFGERYEDDLQAFLKAYLTPGKNELIHPVLGALQNMQPQDFAIQHDAERPDYCEVEVAWIEATTGNEFFIKEFPLSKVDEILNKIEALLDDVQNLIDKALAPLRTAKKWMNKVKSLVRTALCIVVKLRGELVSFVSTTKDFVNYPRAFFNDLQTALTMKSLDSKSSVGSYSAIANWQETRSQINSIAALPEALIKDNSQTDIDIPSGTTRDDIKELIALVNVQTACALAAEAVTLFSDTEQVQQLSPNEIEQINNDVRASIQQTIDLQRELFNNTAETVSSDASDIGIRWQDTVSQLKTIGLDVQTLAITLINARPPLIQYTVETPCNAHLLAHKLYQDASRAQELRRLNPLMKDIIESGEVVNVYAK
jgi:prophage DNA circulation protein